VKHTNFKIDIIELFKRVDPNIFMNYGVILENGDIYCDLRDDPGNSIIKLRKSPEPDFNIPGKVLLTHVDKRYAYHYYINYEDANGNIVAKCLRQMNMYDTVGLKDLQKNSRIIYVVTEAWDDPIIV